MNVSCSYSCALQSPFSDDEDSGDSPNESQGTLRHRACLERMQICTSFMKQDGEGIDDQLA